MQIKRFKNTMGDSTFYALMGKYFAEPKYRKEIPYMANRETNVWFIALEKDQVLGFVALDMTNTKIKMEHDYIEEAFRKEGLFEKLNEKRMEYVSDEIKPQEVIVKEQFLIDYWSALGFKPYRTNGAYTYLRKEPATNES